MADGHDAANPFKKSKPNADGEHFLAPEASLNQPKQPMASHAQTTESPLGSSSGNRGARTSHGHGRHQLSDSDEDREFLGYKPVFMGDEEPYQWQVLYWV